MKPAVFVALLALPLSPAFADFNPKDGFACRTEDGTKILVNDEFAGPGMALVSGNRRSYYAGVLRTPDSNSISVVISAGQRALAPDYTLRLNLGQAEEFTGQHPGIRFYSVPVELETTSFFGANKLVSGRCVQSVEE